MNEDILYKAIGDINERYIKNTCKAAAAKGKPVLIKVGTLAACLCLFVLLGVGIWQSDMFCHKSKSDTVLLRNGESIVFRSTASTSYPQFFDLDVEVKSPTEEEHKAVFGALPVSNITAYYSPQTHSFVGFSCRYTDMMLVISTSSANGSLIDTQIADMGDPSIVAGIPVIAGYALTNANSHGERTIIFHATLDCNSYSIYIENICSESEYASVREDLVHAIEQLATYPFDFRIMNG